LEGSDLVDDGLGEEGVKGAELVTFEEVSFGVLSLSTTRGSNGKIFVY
jgi:hypothetical protein